MARRVFISYAQESDEHRAVVRELWAFLRANGVDAVFDEVAAGQRRDWSLWMAERIQEADVVLCVASEQYKLRAEGRTSQDVGRGVQGEARLIRDAFYGAQQGLEKFVPVVLPGQSIDGVPEFLAPATATVYFVEDFTQAGAEQLLRFLLEEPSENLETAGAPRSVVPPVYPAPFVGRAEELKTLVDWCESAESHAGAMVFGVPGSGRTRLVNELCAQMRAKGWNAGFSGDHGLLPSSAARTLVVIDHAEIARLARVLEILNASVHDRTRVLLVGQASAPDVLWDQVTEAAPGQFAERPLVMSLNQRLLSTRELSDLTGSRLPLETVSLTGTPLEYLLAVSLHRIENRQEFDQPETWADSYFRVVVEHWTKALTADLPSGSAYDIAWTAAVAGLRPDELGELVHETLGMRLRTEWPTGWSVLPAPDGSTLLGHEYVIARAASRSNDALNRLFTWVLSSPGRLRPFLVRVAAAAIALPDLRGNLVHLLRSVFARWPWEAEQDRGALLDALSMCVSAVETVVSPEVAGQWRDLINEAEDVSTLDFLGTGDQRARTDALDRGPWVDALVTMLRPLEKKPLDRDATGPSVIAIDGPWGAGKTSLMGFVQEKLDQIPAAKPRQWFQDLWVKRWLTLAGAIYLLWRKPKKLVGDREFPTPVKPVTVWFNPWAHQSSDQVWAGMARSILEAVSNQLFANEHEKARYWLRRNGSRLDRGALRRALLRSTLSPLVKLAVLAAAVPIGAALLRYDRPIDVLGVHIASGPAAAKWIAACLALAAVLDTLRRFFFGRAANWSPAGLLDGPVLSGPLAQAGADAVLRDPLYHARSGFLYLLQHDIRELLQDAADQRLSVVVFVDDLDRCNPKTACEVLEAVNLFVSEAFPATKFVIGLDMAVVAAQIDQVMKDFKLEGTRRYFDDPSAGWTFLRKLVQLPVLLPRIERSTMERMVIRFLGEVATPIVTLEPAPEKPATPAEAAGDVIAAATVMPTTEAPQPESMQPGQDEPTKASYDLAKLERHPVVRRRLQERLDSLPVQSAREAKRLLTVWQFYLRVLSAGGSPGTGADQVTQAKGVVLLAELVVRWPALSAHLFGVKDGEQGVTVLRAAAPKDDVTWTVAAAKVGLDPSRDKTAAKALRNLLREDDSYLLAALARRLL